MEDKFWSQYYYTIPYTFGTIGDLKINFALGEFASIVDGDFFQLLR
jgi:hypothetical protein